MNRVFVVVGFFFFFSSTSYLPSLILHKLSRPRPISDCTVILIFVQVDLSEVLAVQMHRRMKEQHKVEEVIDQLQKGTKPEITVFKKQKR